MDETVRPGGRGRTGSAAVAGVIEAVPGGVRSGNGGRKGVIELWGLRRGRGGNGRHSAMRRGGGVHAWCKCGLAGYHHCRTIHRLVEVALGHLAWRGTMARTEMGSSDLGCGGVFSRRQKEPTRRGAGVLLYDTLIARHLVVHEVLVVLWRIHGVLGCDVVLVVWMLDLLVGVHGGREGVVGDRGLRVRGERKGREMEKKELESGGMLWARKYNNNGKEESNPRGKAWQTHPSGGLPDYAPSETGKRNVGLRVPAARTHRRPPCLCCLLKFAYKQSSLLCRRLYATPPLSPLPLHPPLSSSPSVVATGAQRLGTASSVGQARRPCAPSTLPSGPASVPEYRCGHCRSDDCNVPADRLATTPPPRSCLLFPLVPPLFLSSLLLTGPTCLFRHHLLLLPPYRSFPFLCHRPCP